VTERKALPVSGYRPQSDEALAEPQKTAPSRGKLLTFSEALTALKAGSKIARDGWNGRRMWLMLVEANEYVLGAENISVHTGMAPIKQEGGLWQFNYTLLPWIGMKTADDKFVPWLASQTDILAEDWRMAQ